MDEKDTKVEDQDKTLERMTTQLKGIGDAIEGLPDTVKEEVDRRVKEIVGDSKAHYEEMKEKLDAADARLTAAIQEQRAPGNVATATREEDYGYGNEPGGFDEMIAEVRAAGSGMGVPERLRKCTLARWNDATCQRLPERIADTGCDLSSLTSCSRFRLSSNGFPRWFVWLLEPIRLMQTSRSTHSTSLDLRASMAVWLFTQTRN